MKKLQNSLMTRIGVALLCASVALCFLIRASNREGGVRDKVPDGNITHTQTESPNGQDSHVKAKDLKDVIVGKWSIKDISNNGFAHNSCDISFDGQDHESIVCHVQEDGEKKYYTIKHKYKLGGQGIKFSVGTPGATSPTYYGSFAFEAGPFTVKVVRRSDDFLVAYFPYMHVKMPVSGPGGGSGFADDVMPPQTQEWRRIK